MVNRRAFLGTAALTLAVPGAGAIARASDRDWSTVATPTSNTLQAVTNTTGGPVAAGSNGVVLARSGTDWETVLQNGPGGNGNNLTALEPTADGRRVWLAGASGALGEYDVETGAVRDRTAPDGVTDNLTAVAVTGPAGEANVFLADASGAVHVSLDDGRPGTWTHLKPGSGAAIHDIDCEGATTGTTVDGTQAVFETDTGTDWERVGIDDADGSLYAVAADGSNTVAVGDLVYRRDATGWTPMDPAAETLQNVAICRCGCPHAVGGSGTILHGPGRPGARWRKRAPTGENLHGIAVGRPHVAVGASGTVLER